MRKLGFDIHGVIDTNPQYFAGLLRKYRSEGFEIHIITGTRKIEMDRKLADWGIKYDHYFGIADWCMENSPTVRIDADGNIFDDDDVWDNAKAEYCKREGIDVHVDDSTVYYSSFQNIATRFVLFDKDDRLEMRSVIATIKESCDYYPCTKDCPQYILYRDKVKRAITQSRLAKTIPNEIVFEVDPNGGSISRPVSVDDLIVDLVDAIFEELI